MKTCTKCGVVKPLSDFFKDNSKKHGYRAICKECSQAAFRAYTHRVGYNKIRYERIKNAERWRHIAKKYGITPEQYAALLEAQGGQCAVCGTASSGRRPFCVDHNHITGEVRGLLCTPCNQMIGHAKDDPVRLRQAAKYLESVPQVAAEIIRAILMVDGGS